MCHIRLGGKRDDGLFNESPYDPFGLHQTCHVLNLIRHLKALNIVVLEQVVEVCDRLIVLRLGRKVADEPVANLDGPTLVGYVTGLRRAEA